MIFKGNWDDFVYKYNNWNILPSKPDDRDFPLTKIAKVSSNIVRKASLDHNVPFVLDQKNTPKCVGFALTGIMNGYFNFYNKLPEGGFSPEFVYWLADDYDDLPSGTKGTTLRAALKVAHKIGMLPWKFLPFRNDHVRPKITQEMFDEAAKYKIKGYARLYSFEEICQAIMAGKFVLIGTVVTKHDWSDGYILTPEGDYYLGGHATYISEYDLDMVFNTFKTFIGGFNSWGEEWGLDGQFWMSKAFTEYELKDMNMNALFEAWAIDMPELPKPKVFHDEDKIIKEFNVAPHIKDGRIFLALRDLSKEILGLHDYNFHWDNKEKKAVINTKDKIITMWEGKKEFEVKYK